MGQSHRAGSKPQLPYDQGDDSSLVKILGDVKRQRLENAKHAKWSPGR